MAQRPSPKRVLIIDDDAMSRDLLSVLLKAKEYAVTAAESGEAALGLLESSPRPDVVLTDMQMPGSTPEQLAGRLRRACGRRTLLLAMSGSRPSDATISHFDGFLMKPFGAGELRVAIEAHGSARPAAAAKGVPRQAPLAPGRRSSGMLESLAASAPASNGGMGAEPHPFMQSAGASAVESAPVLDEVIYRQLAAAMPARQLQEMYAMCVSDAQARIASMRSLAAAHDAAQFTREAHAIKGSCGMLGATEMHRMATTLEKRGLDPDGSGVNSLDEFAAACDRLERMLGSRA